jgi:GGDEF domain-containing protein
LILEDTPENGAVWTVERVRRALAVEHPGQTLWAGIACYPAHAFDAWELFDRAGQALDAAQEWHQDRIEVATSET